MQNSSIQARSVVLSMDEQESLAKTLAEIEKDDCLKVERAEFEHFQRQLGGAVAGLAAKILQEMWTEKKLNREQLK